MPDGGAFADQLHPLKTPVKIAYVLLPLPCTETDTEETRKDREGKKEVRVSSGTRTWRLSLLITCQPSNLRPGRIVVMTETYVGFASPCLRRGFLTSTLSIGPASLTTARRVFRQLHPLKPQTKGPRHPFDRSFH